MKNFEKPLTEQSDNLLDMRKNLPEKLKDLFPQEERAYYEAINKMHCSEKETGGSKFYSAEKGGVDNIL